MKRQHILVALVQNHAGVLNRVVSLFRRRVFNIDSLTVGRTERDDVSRMTIVVDGENTDVEQVVKQLYKVIEVLKVSDITSDPVVVTEIALIKVTALPAQRAEIASLAELFRAKIEDVAADSMIVEVTGTETKIENLLSLLRPYGIKEMVRTGAVAMTRGASVARISEVTLEAAG
ncbi:MAG: acetolactate synthase small subunit [Chloroflexi bacterium]|nr:acetolactate synthase small subunit [Chloroflexota bacterium]